MKETHTSCDFGINYIRDGRIDIIARGIQKCMNSLNIPLKVVGTLLPELHKFDIKFENMDLESAVKENQAYLASSISVDLDYLTENKQSKDKWEILTAGAESGEFSVINSSTDLIANSIEKCLREFYSFGEGTGKIDVTPFKSLKNITVTARKYFDIKHFSSHKDRFMIEFNISNKKENKEDTLKNIYWKYTVKEN